MSPRRTGWSYRRLLVLVVAAGVVCRLVQYLWQRSFWHDEAYLVLNILDASLGDALGPLKLFQSAPPLFLWAQILISRGLGDSELALRLLPLVAGSLALGLMAWLAWRVAGPVAALVATTMFAFSDTLIWHATESKQYSTDLLIALCLWLAATWGWDRDSPGDEQPVHVRRLLLMSALGVVGVWISTPSVFVYCSASLVLLWAGRMWRSRRAMGTYLLANAAVGASFLAMYALALRHQQYPYLFSYWAPEMVPWQEPGRLPVWVITQFYDLFDYPYEDAGALLLALAMLAGWVLLRRGGQARMLGLLLIAPGALNLLASALHRYPFGGARVTVYLVPAILLLPSIGVAWLLERPFGGARWKQLAVRLVPVGLVIFGAINAGYHLLVPRHRGHVRPAADFVEAHRLVDERVFVLGEIEPLLCYWREPDVDHVGTETTPDAADEITEDRYWILYTYSTRRGKRSREAVVEQLARDATVTDTFEIEGAAAYRFARPSAGHAQSAH